jgi:hypothetical protein
VCGSRERGSLVLYRVVERIGGCVGVISVGRASPENRLLVVAESLLAIARLCE